ncbi:hypothetical protein GCM10007301_48970 [Azorhizobium oxalatiphilum]|uniref:Peptidase M48 domain-containing protein n=1 Tax=Azorhizobium oxalatiphilum TaxID=980631 RepID=A0A917CB96_9HYPH|nr:M48 family metalloprotease [Azorhizobium oxalatiphilum]GGF83038.1 hypothetical protein GCM10007301_48970 [Azorhizobium oxalatiphilum]
MSATRHFPKPISAGRRTARFVIGALAACQLLLTPAFAQAPQGKGLPVIRDTEIENLLKDYTRPILRVAKLSQQNIEVVLINDRAFNAFVADGRRIFVNTGALVDATTPNQIIGVLAHETGHIAGGHLARRREQLAGAQTMAIVAMMLAAGGVAAGAASGNNMGNAAAGAIIAPQEMIRRSLLSYQREEEQAADRAAVTYLNATKQSAKGMLETFERFQNDQLFISQRIDPYLLSHPMARERIAALETLAKASPYFNAKDSPELQHRHDMMRAKLVGFQERPDGVARRYPPTDQSLPAQYARAISAYRFGNMSAAVAQIDALIAKEPGNPYFPELKGQALLESGRAAEALPPLRKAVSMTDGAPLIRAMLGQALVETGNAAYMDEAIRELQQATQRDPGSPGGWRALAKAYGMKNNRPAADLASAQASLITGDFRTAQMLAARAKQTLPPNSPGWLRADDILNSKPPKSDDR